MDASLIARMKELEAENARLKKMYIETQIKNDLLSEALGKLRDARWPWMQSTSTV